MLDCDLENKSREQRKEEKNPFASFGEAAQILSSGMQSNMYSNICLDFQQSSHSQATMQNH